jgi:hypothetical protein
MGDIHQNMIGSIPSMTVANIKGPLASNDENFTEVGSFITVTLQRLKAVFSR